MTTTTDQPPWFVLPDSKRMAFHNAFNCSKKPLFRRPPASVRGKKVVVAQHGWMIMRQKIECCLWNPATQQVIHLPSLKIDGRNLNDDTQWLLLSQPPDEDCRVLIAGKTSFHIWKLNDKHWSEHDYELVRNGVRIDNHYIYRTFINWNGNIYGFTNRGQVAVIQSGTSGILSARLLNFISTMAEGSEDFDELVESCGEVYLVRVSFVGFSKPPAVDHVDVFKMDFTAEVFVRVQNLGDRVFFLAVNGSKSFSAAKLGLKGNCVYIIHGKDVHVFDLDDGSLYVYRPCMNPPVQSFAPFWFVPSNGLIRMYGDGDKGTKESTTRQEAKVDQVVECKGHHLLDLPAEILQLIGTRVLPLASNYMIFRLVCSTLRCSAPPIRLSTQFPLLIFGNRRHSRCSISDPIKNIAYSFDFPELLGAKIRFSKEGWLLMSKDDILLFFFNPYTQGSVTIPKMASPQSMEVVCFSSPPAASDCTIIGICVSTFHSVTIFTLRLGEYRWSIVKAEYDEFFYPSNNCPVYHEGSFYCLGVKGELGVFNAWDLSWKVLPMPRPCSSIHQNYLVESNGELISIFVGYRGTYVHAYSLDHSNMKWQTVSNLKDQTLFLCQSSSISVKMLSEGPRSRIYFPISFDNSFLFYSLETSRWHSAFGNHCRADTYSTSQRLNCAWFQPSNGLDELWLDKFCSFVQ